MSDKDVVARRIAEELERQGDEAAKAGEPSAGQLYRQAQKILLPVGTLWSDAEEYDRRQCAFNRIQQKIWALHALPPSPPRPIQPSESYNKFTASTIISYEQWHDGIGYDLEALATATEQEHAVVADDLIRRLRNGEGDWRDVEALTALNVPSARQVLEKALPCARPALRLHIALALTAMGATVEIDRIIADILCRGTYEDGLSLALDLAPRYATSHLREVLLDCARDGKPDVRVHAAALSLYLAGKADSPFDLSQRPFLLQFGEEDRATRERAFAELCRRIGHPVSGTARPGNN